jgi:uncharacterized protein YqgC (DUF456 family)
MDILLLLIGLVCMILGVLGSFLPVLPGPLMSWIGLLLLYFTDAVAMNYWMLGITFVVTVIITILDFVIPAQGTKRFGGSRYGIWGTNIGLVVGFFSPIPFGIVIGPFIGALIGELIYNSTDHNRAIKAATGSFLGFLASAFIQFVICMAFFGIFFYVTLANWPQLF